MAKTFSTGEVVKIVGIDRMTLWRWLKDGKIPEPKRIRDGGIEARIWTDRDVERARKYKQENYRKGRGRKPKSQ